jgi:hypothetical protein
MDLDGAHQEDSLAAKSMLSRCQTMCVHIAIYFTTSIIFCGALLNYFVYLVQIVVISLG